MTRPRLRVTSVTIGTARPHDLAHFYARLLGWPVTAEDPAVPGDPVLGGWAQIRAPEGESGPTLNFEYERHFTRPVWPSVPGRQTASQHLDIEVADLGAAVEWAVAQGATVAGFQPQDDVRVLFDPDGHPFCLFR
jgi:catechol 2,3-dioxygenase-like lactoylglutathione lyase family enzyme